MRINYFFILIICHINYLKEITIQTKLNKTKKLNRCPIKKMGVMVEGKRWLSLIINEFDLM